MTDGYGYRHRPDGGAPSARARPVPPLSVGGARSGVPSLGPTAIPGDAVPGPATPPRLAPRRITTAAREVMNTMLGVDVPDPGHPVTTYAEGPWTSRAGLGLSDPLVMMLALDTSPGAVVAVGWAFDGVSTVRAVLARSTDGGLTWAEPSLPSLGAGPVQLLQSVYFDAPRDRWVAAAIDSDGATPLPVLLWSDDDGVTWTVASAPTFTLSVAGFGPIVRDPASGHLVVPFFTVADDDAVGLRSADGQTWVSVPGVLGTSLTSKLAAAAPALGVLAAVESISAGDAFTSADVEDWAGVAITGIVGAFFPYPTTGSGTSPEGQRPLAWAAFLGRFFGVGRDMDDESGVWLRSSPAADAFAAVPSGIDTLTAVVSCEQVSRLVAVGYGAEALGTGDGTTLAIEACPSADWCAVAWQAGALRAIALGTGGEIMTKDWVAE